MVSRSEPIRNYDRSVERANAAGNVEGIHAGSITMVPGSCNLVPICGRGARASQIMSRARVSASRETGTMIRRSEGQVHERWTRNGSSRFS